MQSHGTIKEHILELKKRVIHTLLFFVLTFILCYSFSEKIFNFLLQPLLQHGDLSPTNMIYTSLTEAFFAYLHIASVTAMILSIPFGLYQLYIFLKPAMNKDEYYIAKLLIYCFIILASIGFSFAYYVVIPKAWGFFLAYQSMSTELPLILQARISEYIILVINLVFAFALAFQLPNILIMLTLAGLLSPQTLTKYRRIAIITIFIIAALLTPPDIFSQIALALPMVLLYEISIIICKNIEKRRKNA